MQFVDLNLQQKRIRHDLERRILAVLDHGKYIMGPDVAELEAALVSCTGARHCINLFLGHRHAAYATYGLGYRARRRCFCAAFHFFCHWRNAGSSRRYPDFVDILPDTCNLQSGNFSSWAQYTIRVPEPRREHVRMYLQKRKISVNIYYPRPMHMLGVFSGLDYAPASMPESYRA